MNHTWTFIVLNRNLIVLYLNINWPVPRLLMYCWVIWVTWSWRISGWRVSWRTRRASGTPSWAHPSGWPPRSSNSQVNKNIARSSFIGLHFFLFICSNKIRKFNICYVSRKIHVKELKNFKKIVNAIKLESLKKKYIYI